MARATGKPLAYNHNIRDHDGAEIKAHTLVVHVHQYELDSASTSGDTRLPENTIWKL